MAKESLANIEKHLLQVRNVLKRIKEEDVYENGFAKDKIAIEKIFRATSANDEVDVLARLTVIDSLYSTQMNRRYYGLDELATSLCQLSEEKRTTTKKLFLSYANEPDKTLFDFKKVENGKRVSTNLFDEKYGIGKNGKDKGIAISLISKYAYFETGKQFPIYDSIACEVFPIIWDYCGFSLKEKPKLTIRAKGKQLIDASSTMMVYVKAINELKKKFGEDTTYDHIDRLLWFVGKIRRGNLSLVLSREQYLSCVNYSKANHLFKETDEFCVDKVNDVRKLPFINPGSLMEDFFVIAHALK